MLVPIEEGRCTFSDVGARADDEHEDHQETLEIEQCRLLPRPQSFIKIRCWQASQLRGCTTYHDVACVNV